MTIREARLGWIIPALSIHLMACVADVSDAIQDGEDDDEINVTVQGICKGYGNRQTRSLVIAGFVYAQEIPRPGTCNGNNTYTADYRSFRPGFRASIWIQNNGNWESFRGGYDTTWRSYSFHDNNSHSEMHLCVDNGDSWFCGIGDNYIGAHGVDHSRTEITHGF